MIFNLPLIAGVVRVISGIEKVIAGIATGATMIAVRTTSAHMVADSTARECAI